MVGRARAEARLVGVGHMRRVGGHRRRPGRKDGDGDGREVARRGAVVGLVQETVHAREAGRGHVDERAISVEREAVGRCVQGTAHQPGSQRLAVVIGQQPEQPRRGGVEAGALAGRVGVVESHRRRGLREDRDRHRDGLAVHDPIGRPIGERVDAGEPGARDIREGAVGVEGEAIRGCPRRRVDELRCQGLIAVDVGIVGEDAGGLDDQGAILQNGVGIGSSQGRRIDQLGDGRRRAAGIVVVAAVGCGDRLRARGEL